MGDPTHTVVGWLSGTGYRLVLLAGLLTAVLVGWHTWRRTRAPSAHAVWLGAVSILGCLLLWAAFGTLADGLRLDPRLWAAPLDRLLGVAILVTLGWTLAAPGAGNRRWRTFLACGFACAALAYLGWAPIWAQAFHSDPTLTRDTTGLARAWDVWLVVLAVAVGVALLHGTRAPRWLLGVVGGLAIGSLLELVVPISATVPAWSRLGTLVAGTFFVAAAMNQALAIRTPAFDLPWPLRERRASPRAIPTDPAPVQAIAPPTSDLDRVLAEIERQAANIGSLTVLVQGLSDRLAALERPADVAAGPTSTARGPEQHAAQTADPDGERDLTVAAIAALEATTDARGVAAGHVNPPLGAVNPVLAAHVARYERALARLPWGIVVADADDRIAIANPAAVGLLHVHQAPVGTTMAHAFPDADRMAYALHRARQRGPDTTETVVLQFESPGLQAELDPLWDPVAGYLGTVVLLRPRNPDTPSQVEALVPALADALRAPMTSILGYSELLSRMSGLGEDQVSRYLQRIDANLARMQTMLGNLLTVLELGGDAAAEIPEPVDVESTVRIAVDRARPQFGEKALDVNVTVDGPLPQASANPRALTQIMDNLLAHAALRSPQGGDVTVAAAVREDVGGQRAVVITVRDRGAQLVSGTSGVVEIDEGQSRPVSLTIVRLLAERQGGRAWAESDSHGAQFHVRLPVPRAA